MVDLTRRGTIGIVRIRHGKANAMDLEFCDAFTRCLEEGRDASLGALVVTGDGGIFSAGVDLVRVVDGGADYVRAFLPKICRTFEALFAYPKPVVAAVNGHAIAGGCVVACAADYRVMGRGAGRIGIPELLVGVPFPVVALEIVRFVAPPEYVQSLMYRGATLDPDAAAQHGLVDAVVDPGRLLDEAVAVAESLAALNPEAFHLTKRQIREPAMRRIRDGAVLDAMVEDAWASPQTLLGIRGYMERTFRKHGSPAVGPGACRG